MIFKQQKRETHFVGLFAHHVPICNLLQASRIKCVLSIDNLIRLPPCDLDLGGIRHDHVVATVNYLLKSKFQNLEEEKKENIPLGS